MSRNSDDIRRLFESAAEILLNCELRDGVVVGVDSRKASDGDACVDFAIGCPPIDEPRSPATRDDALPQILLRSPFTGAPTLDLVAFYIGIGFIAVRKVSGDRYSYEIVGIDGHGMEARLAFLTRALHLFFSETKFEEARS